MQNIREIPSITCVVKKVRIVFLMVVVTYPKVFHTIITLHRVVNLDRKREVNKIHLKKQIIKTNKEDSL